MHSFSSLAAVARVSAVADQPEGARRGGKEAAEVACANRDEGASEDQAPEEDLARQVETRQACPAALRGRPRARRQDLEQRHARRDRLRRSVPHLLKPCPALRARVLEHLPTNSDEHKSRSSKMRDGLRPTSSTRATRSHSVRRTCSARSGSGSSPRCRPAVASADSSSATAMVGQRNPICPFRRARMPRSWCGGSTSSTSTRLRRTARQRSATRSTGTSSTSSCGSEDSLALSSVVAPAKIQDGGGRGRAQRVGG
jgi:hypothetical protein